MLLHPPPNGTPPILTRPPQHRQVNELKKLFRSPRMLLAQSLNLAMIVFSALMIWKGLMFATKSESPVVVVLRCV